MNKFTELLNVNVNEHTEKKGKYTYLSWPFAVSELRKADPKATWEVVKFDGKPFCQTECGYFVEVAVTVDGVTLSQVHPVIDNTNKTIQKPNAFQINTSIQRCLVKAIALHGLGLYIYAGEDLPEEEVKEVSKRDEQTIIYKNIKGLLEGALVAGEVETIWKQHQADVAQLPKAGRDSLSQLFDARVDEFNAANQSN